MHLAKAQVLAQFYSQTKSELSTPIINQRCDRDQGEAYRKKHVGATGVGYTFLGFRPFPYVFNVYDPLFNLYG